MIGQITDGRPDFRDHQFGITEIKRFPKYVYSKQNGALIHKIASVKARWWQVSKDGDHLERMHSPNLGATTICGMYFHLSINKAGVCNFPNPGAVLCGRCNGDLPTFSRKRPQKITRRDAHKLIGCISEGE